jgi:alpha-1,6-mannosyltransferase
MNIKNQNIINSKVLYIALFLNIISYIILYFFQNLHLQIVSYFLTIVPAYAGYFVIVFYSLKYKGCSQKDFILILIIALLIRVLLIPSDPFLSDDVYRYLWDGKVIYNGFNPFSFAPAAPVLHSIRDATIYPHVNFPDIPTVYPPLAQLVFAISYVIGYNVIIWKLILLLFEGLLFLFLYKLIVHFSMNKIRLAIYLLNPIVVIETYSSGHLDVIAVCFLIIGIFYFYKNKTWAYIFAFILAILTKYKPIFIVLPFLKKRFLLKISIILGSLVAVLAPFTFTETIPTAGIISYANRWEFNGFLYKIFLYIYDIVGFVPQQLFSLNYNGRVEDFYITGAFYYKLIAFIAIFVILIDQFKKLKMTENFKGVNYLQSSFFVCAAILLLSPTLYPWYLIWLIPFLVFLPNWSWLLFTMLIQLSYYILQGYHTNGVWQESNIILFVQYLPFYSLLIFEYLDKRKIKGWFL